MRHIRLPSVIHPSKIRIIMLHEGLPEHKQDYFYTSRDSLYVTNTIAAFQAAGKDVHSMDDVVKLGVYLTVAVRAVRKDLTFSPQTIDEHSFALEQELALFPNVKVILLMGDAAIRALNCIAKRRYGAKAVPSGSTYKIRKGKFFFGDIRVFPSYLQTGRNFLIEKSKQRMVAEDIRIAFSI